MAPADEKSFRHAGTHAPGVSWTSVENAVSNASVRYHDAAPTDATLRPFECPYAVPLAVSCSTMSMVPASSNATYLTCRGAAPAARTNPTENSPVFVFGPVMTNAARSTASRPMLRVPVSWQVMPTARPGGHSGTSTPFES